MTRDTLFDTPRAVVRPFEFDERVAAVFEDMISRSVPLYREVQQTTATLARAVLRSCDTVYDLGCSTGVTLIALAQALTDETIRIVGVDGSRPMLDECERELSRAGLTSRVELVEADLLTYRPEDARLVIMNYTLQFLEPAARAPLLATVHRALNPGGAFLLSEKIRHDDPLAERLMTELHWEFKRSQGYSELEIAQKRDAIENVLRPLTLNENLALLADAGFDRRELLLKSFTFATVLAHRD